MIDDEDKPTEMTDRHGFTETPSKEEWLGLLGELSEHLAAMERKIEHIKQCELPFLEYSTSNMRARVEMVSSRLRTYKRR